MAVGLVLNRRRQVPAEDTPAFGAIAERFRRGGDLERAVALCQEGLQKFPDHLSARVTLGWALLDLGRYDEAHTALEWVLKRAPDNLAAIRGMAELHQRAESAVELSLDGPGPWPPDQAAIEAAGTAPQAPDATAATPPTKVSLSHDVSSATGAVAGLTGAGVDDVIEQIAAIDDAAPELELSQTADLTADPDLLAALELKSEPDFLGTAAASASAVSGLTTHADAVAPDLDLALKEEEAEAVDLWESLKIPAPLDESIDVIDPVRSPVTSARTDAGDQPIAGPPEVVLDDFIGAADEESADETAALLANLISVEPAGPVAFSPGSDQTILLSAEAVDLGSDSATPLSLDTLLPPAPPIAELSKAIPSVLAAADNAPLVLAPVPLQVDPRESDSIAATPIDTLPMVMAPADLASVEVMADVLPMLAVDEPEAVQAIEDEAIEIDERDAFVLTSPSFVAGLGDVDAESAAAFLESGEGELTDALGVANLSLDFDAPIAAAEPEPVVLAHSPAEAVPMPVEVTAPIAPVALGSVTDASDLEVRFVDYSGATVVDTSMSSVEPRANRKKGAKRKSVVVLEGMLRGIEVRRAQMAAQQGPGA